MPLAHPNTKYVQADQNAVEGALDKFTTAFGDLYTVERRTQLDISSNYPLSERRNDTTTTTNASITSTNDESEITVHADAATGQNAVLDTAHVGRYVSGYAAEAGIGVRLPNRPTGDQQYTWGYYNDVNGFYFGEDANGAFVGAKSSENGNPIKVYQSNWNVDTLDGTENDTNPSELELDLSDGHIFRIQFSWYGYGEIKFQILMRSEDNMQIPVTIHRESPIGRTSVAEPNLPIRAEVDTGTTASAMDMFVGGRQFAIYGTETTSTRVKSDRRLNYSLSGTTWVPVMAIRRKPDRSDTLLNFLGLDILSSDNLVIQVREESTISNGTFTNPTDVVAAETAVQTNTTLTTADQTTGRLQTQFLSSGGATGGSSSLTGAENIDIRFSRDQPVIIFARKVSGTGGSISVVARWQEEW